MENNRINAIEATSGASFKTKKEFTQEKFSKKLSYSQKSHNGDNSNSGKDDQNKGKEKQDPTKAKEHMELQSQSKIFKIMSMLESNSPEKAIKYMKELKRQEEHIKKIEEMTKDTEEK